MKQQRLLCTLTALALASASTVLAQSQTDKKIVPPPSSQQRISYQPLNVKTGLWQTTVVFKRSGAMPVPAGMLESLTPEQRARLEARMQATSAPRTETHQHCFTQEELEHPIDFSEKNCTWTIAESTSTHASGSVRCETSGLVLQGRGTFDALDQEHVKGTEHLTTTGQDGNAMTFDGSFTSAWQGASCKAEQR